MLLCIALGEQHAPCCGDACRSSTVRAFYAPPYCTAEVFDYLLQRRRTFLCAVGVINWDCCMPAPPMSKCSWGRFVPALPEYCWSKCSWSRFMPALPEYCWGRFVPAPPMNSVVSIWSLGGEVQKVAVGSERVCSSVPSRTPSRSIAERL